MTAEPRERDDMAEAKAVKGKYQAELLKKANVVGVAIGYREKAGQTTDQVALTVMVKKKVPLSQLDAKDVIPSEIEGVMVDVREVGEIRALS
jgi:regulatory protein YycI of two-component signal transduction system YycFG